MENEFINKGKMKISYQVGMDGVKHSFTLPHYALILIIVLLIFLVVSTIMMFTMAGSNAQRNEVLKRLETENKELRAKLDFYAATVDSIYKRLNDLQIKIKENPEDYPTLNLKQGKKGEFVFEPALRNQMENLETKLATILVLISEPAKAIPALPVGENPADYIPSIYPSFGRISDGWGLRVHPIRNEIEFHYGLDISNEAGTPIYATAAGTVKTTDYETSYGKRIVINHGNGYETLYGHLYSYMVRSGDQVIKGQIIGLMGSSGISTGPHLHYEVHNCDAKVNPVAYLNRIDELFYAMR
ncbi:MAG TPA: M23 family metallopeptidase [Candidatus Cloacimonas sp.]|nr:M23 family metallopeptidase [Candidatus Cloacimonas sp.]